MAGAGMCRVNSAITGSAPPTRSTASRHSRPARRCPITTTWNVGLGFTYKVFTLDLRYYDTNLTKAECNVLTGDHTATFGSGNITPINPGGLRSKWCSPTFIGKLSFDLTLHSNVK